MEETEAHQMNCKTKSPGSSSSNSTSSNFSTHKPGFHPRTPSSGSTSTASLPSFMSASVMTPPAKRFHFYATQHLQSQTTQQQKVRNPFEAALAERLHLPTIASPSLFQRPTTPQLSSTQFEWTIDDVSSLKPVHVEPCDTQFQDSPDPDYEAKAQSAISSFFKEHQIVPSPVNCPLRQQRILLAEINGNTPIAKPGRRIRDFGTQTALTLPAQLPPELEEALRPYFQPQLALGYDEDGNPSYSKQESNWLSFNSSSGGSGSTGHNVSMRRKLFDIHNIIVLDEQRKVQTPTTPKLLSESQQQQRRCVAIVGKLSDSFEKSSPGLMSRSPSAEPESVSEYYSPNVTTSQRLKPHIDDDELDGLETQTKRRSFLFRSPNAAELSPILPSPKPAASSNRSRQRRKCEASHAKSFETPAKFSQRSAAMTRRRLNANPHDEDDDDANIEIDSSKFTPDRSSSPLHSFYASAAGGSTGRHSVGGVATEMASTFATESFHSRFISRLVVTSANKSHNKSGNAALNLDTTEIIENDDDEAMLVSQLSMHNSNLSSSSINSHCDTPTGKKRSASRKNLSQSFTNANWADEAASSSEDENNGNAEMDKTNLFQVGKQRCKKTLINEIDKKILPLLVQNDANDSSNSGDGDGKQLLLSQPTASANSIELSQQASCRGNFYRTDSGFNEMTSSSTSTALLLLSQQDESSRDAFVLKSSGEVLNKVISVDIDADEMDVSMLSTTRSSTPTKQQQTLSGVKGIKSAAATPSKAAFNDLF